MESQDTAGSKLISVGEARLRLAQELGSNDWLVGRAMNRKRDLKTKKGQWVDRSSFRSLDEALDWQEFRSPTAILRLAIAEGELPVIVDGRADLKLPKDFFHRNGVSWYHSIVGGVLHLSSHLPPGRDEWEQFHFSPIYIDRQHFDAWLSKEKNRRRPDGMLQRKRGRPGYSKEIREEAAVRIARGDASANLAELAREVERTLKRRYPYAKIPRGPRVKAIIAPLWRAKAQSKNA